MHYLQKWRQQYGISQADLATYLHMSRNFLAQIESKRKPLPTKGSLKFGQLESILQNADLSDFESPSNLEEYWQKYQADLEYKILTLERDLDKEKAKLKVLEHRQQLKYILENHLRQMPASEDKESMQVWLNSLKIEDSLTVILDQTFRIEKLELALETLQFELGKVEEKFSQE